MLLRRNAHAAIPRGERIPERCRIRRPGKSGKKDSSAPDKDLQLEGPGELFLCQVTTSTPGISDPDYFQLPGDILIAW